MAKKTTLEEKTKLLLNLRGEIAKADADYSAQVDPLKATRDSIQKEILEDLKSSGQFSAKFQDATVSRAVRKSLQVIDELEVIQALKMKGLDKEYASVQLNDLFYGEYSKGLIKDGITLPGTEINEKEFISVRTAAEAKDRRKVVGEKLSRDKFNKMLEE